MQIMQIFEISAQFATVEDLKILNSCRPHVGCDKHIILI
jgi:hypothetical protein